MDGASGTAAPYEKTLPLCREWMPPFPKVRGTAKVVERFRDISVQMDGGN